MYRIVKRIVHTVTTVTWMVRWEKDSAGQEPEVQEISFPPTHSIVEENVPDMDTKTANLSSKPILDEGEK